MKKNRLTAWIITADLAVAAIVGVAAGAHGQKSIGGTQWLAAMDSDHDGTVSKEEFTTYMDSRLR